MWREATGGQANLERLTHADGSLMRHLLRHWNGHLAQASNPSVTAPQLDAWFSALEEPVAPDPTEPAGAAWADCLALGLTNTARRVGQACDPMALDATGLPAIVRAKRMEEWNRWLATGADPWRLVPTPDGPRPVLAAAWNAQKGNSALRKGLEAVGIEALQRQGAPLPEARAWATEVLQHATRNRLVRTPDEWLAMARAAGPANVRKAKEWQKIGRLLEDLSWFDALIQDPAFAPALGADTIRRHQVTVALEILAKPEAKTAVGPATFSSHDTVMRHLEAIVEAHGWPDGDPWGEAAAVTPMPDRIAARLGALGRRFPTHWARPDPDESERALLLRACDLLERQRNAPKSQWQRPVGTFLAMTRDSEAGPWLRVTRALLEALMAPNGKQFLDLDLLKADGAATVGRDPTALAAMGAVRAALGTAARPPFDALIHGWELEATLPGTDPPRRAGPRL